MTERQQLDTPLLFKVRNHHGASYGTPPEVDGDVPRHSLDASNTSWATSNDSSRLVR